MSKQNRNLNEGTQPDITKKPIALVLPGLIAGIFILLSILLTAFLNWWLSKPKEKEKIKCNLKTEMSHTIEMIDKATLRKEMDKDYKLILSAIFQPYTFS